MTTSRRYLFLLLAASLMTGTSCNPTDPGCVSDGECRQGRLCVEGACTGELPNADDDADGQNNGSDPDDETDSNNADSNNADPNNDDSNNDDQNNAAQCTSGTQCEDGDEVCSWADDTRARECVDPWVCNFFEGDEMETACTFRWSCEPNRDLRIDCAANADGSWLCSCSDADGPHGQFHAEAGICGGEYNALADAANVACGFRLAFLAP